MPGESVVSTLEHRQRETMKAVARWLRLELRNQRDQWTRATLNASAKALDPRWNPRLR